ncbi:hypothetical protein ACNF7N_09305 [Campylobacter coli]
MGKKCRLDDEDKETKWRLSFLALAKNEPLGYLEYKEAFREIADFSLIQSEEKGF